MAMRLLAMLPLAVSSSSTPPPHVPDTHVINSPSALQAALRNASISHVFLTPGTYAFSDFMHGSDADQQHCGNGGHQWFQTSWGQWHEVGAALCIEHSVTIEAEPGTVVLRAQPNEGQWMRVVIIKAPWPARVAFIGLSITGGYAPGNHAWSATEEPWWVYGGGILIDDYTFVDIRHCSIFGNHAYYGGGLFTYFGWLFISDTIFSFNVASASDCEIGTWVSHWGGEFTNVTFINDACNVMLNIKGDPPITVHCPLGFWVYKAPFILTSSVSPMVGCPFECAAGYYGNTSTLHDYRCSGECPTGHYCPPAAVEPIPCPRGTYLPLNGGISEDSCISCTPGTFNDQLGLTNGQPSHSSRSGCFRCPAGTYNDDLRLDACFACPSGGFCSEAGAASISSAFQECPAGTYNPTTAAVAEDACIQCPPGTSNPIPGSQRDDACLACLAGSFAPTAGSQACGLCAPGKFQNVTGGTQCKACDTGSYCPEGASAPLPCREGTYSGAINLVSADECWPAEPGHYAPTGSIAPTPCAAGTFGAALRLSECTRCLAGEYQDGEAETACKPCESGHFCLHGAAAPLPCPPGTWSKETNLVNASECITVSSGHFAPIGSSEQTACRADTYNPREGQSNDAACIPCPPHSVTNGVTGGTSLADCVCEPTFYNKASKDDHVDCTVCPSGSDCFQPGFSIHTLPVKRGYYRRHELSDDVRRCPDAAVNCSESPECPESTSGCRGTVSNSLVLIAGRRLEGVDTAGNSSMGCYDDLTGTYCLLCAPHPEGKRVYYAMASSSSRSQCRECRDSARDAILIFFGVVALALFAIFLSLIWYLACLSGRRKKQLQYAWLAFTPHNKLKVLIGFYMIATKVGTVYEVDLPPSVQRMLNAFSVGVSFGFNSLSSVLECLDMRGYVNTLVLYMITPLVIAVLIVLIALVRMLCSRKRTASALLEDALPALLKLAFLAYPLVCNIAFEAFSCYEFTDSQWLKADVAIQCNTREHHDALVLAWVAIFIYPIGLLILNASLLFVARRAIGSGRPTPLSRSISFLHREYERPFFWWELVEMLRRLVLVGLMVLAQGSMLQILMGTLLSAAFLLFQAQASPYKEPSDDYLASASSFGLVAIFLCSEAFKQHELVGVADIHVRMSTEQRSLYIIDQTTLTFIMLGSVLGILLLSFIIFVVQFTVEGQRLRREARSSKARRLRSKVNDREVELPDLEDGHFHLFLSHVWGTGQDQMRVIKQKLLEMMPDACIFLDVDDLKEGRGAEYVDRSEVILIFLSNGYFTSPNCMRELLRAKFDEKPLLTLIESDISKGGLTAEQVRGQLEAADGEYARWGLADEMHAWNFVPPPTASELYDALYSKDEPVEWNRIGIFQDVTLRLIASRMVNVPSTDVYVQGELISQPPKMLMVPTAEHHIYCSPHNVGASALMMEVGRERNLEVTQESEAGANKQAGRLYVTEEIAHLPVSDHMLLYLTAQTWTCGEASVKLGEELMKAMDLGIHILLCHEMPGVGGQADRHGCEFALFFSNADGATPAELLKRGIYSEIALPLKGGAWREASMVVVGLALGMSKEDIANAQEGRGVLGISEESMRKGMHSAARLVQSSRLKASKVRSAASRLSIVSIKRHSDKCEAVQSVSSSASHAEDVPMHV